MPSECGMHGRWWLLVSGAIQATPNSKMGLGTRAIETPATFAFEAAEL